MHTTQQARSYGRDSRPMPAATPELQLEPLATSKQGFAAREPMVTAEQLRTVALPAPGMRYVRRGFAFVWTHQLEMQPGDLDCTEFDDEQFEQLVRETEAQALASDRAVNAAKASPAYYAAADHFALEQQIGRRS